MENSRQNTRFHWRNAKRLERLSKIMDTTDDGTLQVNEGVIVDVNNDTISVTQEMKDAISGNNEVVISITDDDWDEDKARYVKHVELNNTYISFNFTGTHDVHLVLYCPYFKGLLIGYEQFIIDEFNGLMDAPEERYVSLHNANLPIIAVFNGIVTQLNCDL